MKKHIAKKSKKSNKKGEDGVTFMSKNKVNNNC